MRKFTESLSRDIFESEDVLHELLVDFTDSGLSYTTNYNLQKEWDGNIYSVGNSITGFDELFKKHKFSTDNYKNLSKDELLSSGYVRGYILKFKETYNIVTSEVQRGDNNRFFGVPTEKTYDFIDIARVVQARVEAMGYTFLLSMKDSEYDIMILQGKFK